MLVASAVLERTISIVPDSLECSTVFNFKVLPKPQGVCVYECIVNMWFNLNQDKRVYILCMWEKNVKNGGI